MTHEEIFALVEKRFDHWYNERTQPGAPCNSDIMMCYEGNEDQDPVCSKYGAIMDAIEALYEYCEEEGIKHPTKEIINSFDLEALFQI